MPKNPNPQGKGLVPVLQGLDHHRLQQRLLPPKQIDQVEMELFTSLFVLRSDFKFNPVPGRPYYLYQVEGRFRMLLIAPHEWPRAYRGRYIGESMLQEDRTWTLSLDPAVAADESFMSRIEDERRRLHEALEAAGSVEEVLPVHEGELPFYARLLAFTLGKSLDASMYNAGIKGLSYQEARGLLRHEGHEGGD